MRYGTESSKVTYAKEAVSFYVSEFGRLSIEIKRVQSFLG
jgi:hypothetical protein